MIERQLVLHYNFPKPYPQDKDYPMSSDVDGVGWDEENNGGDVDKNLFYTYFNEQQSGRGLLKEKDKFYDDNSKFDVAANKQRRKVCLLDRDVAHTIDCDNVLQGEVGEEVTILSKLFCGQDYDYHAMYYLQSNDSFPNWDKLIEDGHALPTKEIVIFDRYLFLTKKNDDVIMLVDDINESNFFPLIRVLTNSCINNVKIIIITIAYEAVLKSLEVYREKLIKYIETVYEGKLNVQPQFILIPYKKEFVKGSEKCMLAQKIQAPHDRIIITDYRMFRSGDSFHYFTPKGERMTQGDSLDVDSMGKMDIQLYAEGVRRKLNKVCSGLRKFVEQYPDPPRILGEL